MTKESTSEYTKEMSTYEKSEDTVIDDSDIEIVDDDTLDEIEDIEDVDLSELSKMPDIETMFLNELYKYPLLSADEQEKLGWLKDTDKLAAEKLFHHNLRLVVSVAKYYRNFGLDFMELIQEGCIGLLEGIKRFDPSKGFKLTTYSMWWIKRKMLRAIQDTGSAIRLPTHLVEKKFIVNKLRAQLKKEAGRDPSVEEICEITGFTLDAVQSIVMHTDNIVSIDSILPGGDKYDATIGDMIPDDKFSIDSNIEMVEVHNILDSILDDLDDRSRQVIELRFGYNGNRVHTLEEVGQKFNLTRERVRQIENKAIRKMRIRAKRTNALSGYGIINLEKENRGA